MFTGTAVKYDQAMMFCGYELLRLPTAAVDTTRLPGATKSGFTIWSMALGLLNCNWR